MVVLLILTVQQHDISPNFFQLEAIILLLQIFVGCLYSSPYASGLLLLQSAGIIVSLYQQSIAAYGNSLAAVCSYAIFVILNEPYYVKFAYGASGALFAYVALAYSLDQVTDSDQINSRLSYVISVVSAISISCNDAIGAIT